MQTPWPAGLVERVALALEMFEDAEQRAAALADVAEEFEVGYEDLQGWAVSPVFKGLVSAARKKARENHTLFEMGAAALAEQNLSAVGEIVSNSKAPAMARLRGMEMLAQWGKLAPDPRGAAGPGGAGGSRGPTINITFAGEPGKGVVIESSPERKAALPHEAAPAIDFTARLEEMEGRVAAALADHSC